MAEVKYIVKHDLAYIKGDSYSFQVADVGEVDRMYMTVKCPSGLVRVQKKYYKDSRVGKTEGIEPQADGSYIITLEPSDSDNLKCSLKYNYDVQIIVGKVKKTIVKGKITLDEEYTCCRNEV